MTEKKTTEKKEKGLLAYIGLGLSWGLFALVILVGVAAIGVPFATGATPLTVLTGSMEPAYPPGTLVIVKPIDAKDIKIGDPITYQIKSGEDTVVTHRVISIGFSALGELSFLTKGDANGAADEKPVVPEQIKGKVWYSIPYIGWLNTLMNGQNRGIIIQILAVGLLLYAGYMVASSIAGRARKRREEALKKERKEARKQEKREQAARDAEALASRSDEVPSASIEPGASA